jgi:hypothetical protein
MASDGDCAPGSARRIASFIRFIWNIRRPNGIRRRLNATARHVKARDYAGRASRRYLPIIDNIKIGSNIID